LIVVLFFDWWVKKQIILCNDLCLQKCEELRQVKDDENGLTEVFAGNMPKEFPSKVTISRA
jgi:hypothetical protein